MLSVGYEVTRDLEGRLSRRRTIEAATHRHKCKRTRHIARAGPGHFPEGHEALLARCPQRSPPNRARCAT